MIKMVDHNFLKSRKGAWPRPSLDLMKMAAYLRKEYPNEEFYLVTSMQSLNEDDVIYYFGDMEIEDVPKELYLFKNVKFFGKNFERIPRLAEHLRPDPFVYKAEIQKRLADDEISEKKALEFLDSIYYKAFDEEGRRLPLPAFRREKICIYDEDFFANEECWTVLDEIIETRKPSSIIFPRRIVCHNLSSFFKIRKDYPKISRANKFILDFYVPTHQLETYFGRYTTALKGQITNNSDVSIYIGKNYTNNASSEMFYIRNLYYSLNLIFSYFTRQIPISVLVWRESNTLLLHEDIYTRIAAWANSGKKDITLEEYFCKSKKGAKLYEDLIKKHYVFKKFFVLTKEQLFNNRGVWIVE